MLQMGTKADLGIEAHSVMDELTLPVKHLMCSSEVFLDLTLSLDGQVFEVFWNTFY